MDAATAGRSYAGPARRRAAAGRSGRRSCFPLVASSARDARAAATSACRCPFRRSMRIIDRDQPGVLPRDLPHLSRRPGRCRLRGDRHACRWPDATRRRHADPQATTIDAGKSEHASGAPCRPVATRSLTPEWLRVGHRSRAPHGRSGPPLPSCGGRVVREARGCGCASTVGTLWTPRSASSSAPAGRRRRGSVSHVPDGPAAPATGCARGGRCPMAALSRISSTEPDRHQS